MENACFMKTVVKHLVDGTLDDTLCRICLGPLGSSPENICTKIYQASEEFSVAGVLESLSHIKLNEADNLKVCSECFISAFTAYKFITNFKRSNEILEFYTEELCKNLSYIESSRDLYNDSICITLEEYLPKVKALNYDIVKFLNKNIEFSHEEFIHDPYEDLTSHDLFKSDNATEDILKAEIEKKLASNENIVIVVKENGVPGYFKLNDNGILEPYEAVEEKVEPGKKKRKVREPMPVIQCSRCDVKLRFLKKLKTHMKSEHDVDLFICKVCKATTECELEFNRHMQMHTDVHCCAICNAVFKRRETIIAHLNWHETTNNLNECDNVNVCEICGAILASEEEIQEHYDKKHERKHTCHYCGKRYRQLMSLEKHLKKHEIFSKKNDKNISNENLGKLLGKLKEVEITKSSDKSSQSDHDKKGKVTCPQCNRNFVDERALRWHTRLHTNERPYKCDQCGRGFVTASRRNQHAVCSHLPPARRCPLCPALFHLRSMVNSHLKKVHLQTHKRRNRSRRQQNQVAWRTEPVAIQDLSIDIQEKILELQTAEELPSNGLGKTHQVPLTTDFDEYISQQKS